ncbi:uncharacterized protein Dsimw501_GD10338, isoform B [Drosophila simulans]|uniref:Uncharacterized protein, isoform B n=1 Tax=Drosophila simulans TaxID=7240 RepID=A0A0J9R6G9_DROSI|nr:uncharacterized protein Dsimw501_GD10338, isoform B [Drosophila simulans]
MSSWKTGSGYLALALIALPNYTAIPSPAELGTFQEPKGFFFWVRRNSRQGPSSGHIGAVLYLELSKDCLKFFCYASGPGPRPRVVN